PFHPPRYPPGMGLLSLPPRNVGERGSTWDSALPRLARATNKLASTAATKSLTTLRRGFGRFCDVDPPDHRVPTDHPNTHRMAREIPMTRASVLSTSPRRQDLTSCVSEVGCAPRVDPIRSERAPP